MAVYLERPCLSCARPVGITEPGFAKIPLCQSCNERWHEHMASVIAGAYGQRYDPAEEHDIGECARWLERLYGKPQHPCQTCGQKHVFGE